MMMASSSPSVNDSLQTTCCPMVPAATSVLTCSGASLDSAPGGTGVTTAVPPLSQPGQPAPSQPRNQPPSSSMASTLRPPTAPEQLGNNGVRCPRCDSPNTKFCYYNNYSLAQPRHFCKTCRRYWTRGGALRNVPVGGGCRKNKGSKSKSSSASSATGGASAPSSLGAATGLFTSYSASSSSGVDHNARGGADQKMDFFEQAAGCRGLSFVVPQVASSNLALQLGMSGTLAFANNSRLFSPVAASNGYFDGFFSGNGNHHEFFLPTASNAAAITSSPQEKPTSPVGATSVIGFSYPLPLPPTTETGRGCVSTSSTSLTNSDSHMSSGAGGHHSQLASSIESLSIINQDLHWRLQQQRLAMLYGAGGDGTTSMPYDGELVAPQQPAYLYEIARQHQATTTTATTCTLPFQTSAPDADDGGSKQTVITAADHQLQVSPGGYGTSGNDVWYLHGSGIGGNSNSNSDGNSNGWGTIAASAHPWSELHHQFGAVP